LANQQEDEQMAHMFMPVYNIDAPVGAGQPNSVDDVKLVQMLLMPLGRHMPRTFQGLPPLTANGTFDANLGNWILAFQRDPPRLVKDGKINPIRAQDGHFVPNMGAHSSTLLVLNFNCAFRDAAAHRRIAEQMRLLVRTHVT
jgi:hypothetical protein